MARRLKSFLAFALLFGGLFGGLGSGSAYGQGNTSVPAPSAATVSRPSVASDEASSRGFKICKAQTYALCATASCTVLNQVAYCQCDVKTGDSISLPLKVDGQDVCSINADGAKNGYMVSTFSVPQSVVAPDGDQALYTCPAATSDGGYAQCDGGFCFTSSEGSTFPGFDKPLGQAQIICACPITVSDPATARVGYQIAGPYPCDNSYFRYCKSEVANTRTGSTVKVGAPTGTARFLAQELTGSVPSLHDCPAPPTKQR